MRLITNKVRTRHRLLLILLLVGLTLSLVGVAFWRGEQYEVEAGNFPPIFWLSMMATAVLGALLIVGALYLRKWMKHQPAA
jgi:uncharacterized membrane protein